LSAALGTPRRRPRGLRKRGYRDLGRGLGPTPCFNLYIIPDGDVKAAKAAAHFERRGGSRGGRPVAFTSGGGRVAGVAACHARAARAGLLAPAPRWTRTRPTRRRGLSDIVGMRSRGDLAGWRIPLAQAADGARRLNGVGTYVRASH
jgi:hypothetical protein